MLPKLPHNSYATYMVVAQRSWQAIAGVVTVLLIAFKLNSDQQGWYYTFLSVAAFYTFFEMGLSSVVLQLASHQFVNLRWTQRGGVEGQGVDVYTSFFAQSLKVYAVSAITFFCVIFCFGWYLFGHRALSEDFDWLGAWWVLVAVTALNMTTLPFFSIREGGGQFVEVYGVRLIQGVFGSLACWYVLIDGGFLWATVMLPLVSFTVFIIWITAFVPRTLCLLKDGWGSKAFSWISDIWPLQWRVGLGFISVFIWSQLSTPVLFYYQDAVAAGQMGLSLTIAHTVGLVAQSWIATSIPEIARAAALGNWELWNQLFRMRLTYASLIYMVLAFGVFFVGSIISSEFGFSERVLSFSDFLLLFVFVFLNLVASALATQLRSLKKEPLALVFLLGALATVIGLFGVAPTYGSSGVVILMVAIQIFCVCPLSWMIWRFVKAKACVGT